MHVANWKHYSSQVFILVLSNTCWMICGSCPIIRSLWSFYEELESILFVCKEGGDVSVAEGNTVVLTSITVGPYREAWTRQSRTAVFCWLCCDWQQGSLLPTNRRGRLCGAQGSTEHIASGPHGRGIKIQSRTAVAWDDCACKCCHSEDVLRLMFRCNSKEDNKQGATGRKSVEKNIGFTTMGVK